MYLKLDKLKQSMNSFLYDESSVKTGFTKESSATLIKLKDYIQKTLPGEEENDDAATVITSIVNTDEQGDDNIEKTNDENNRPKGTRPPSITASFSDDGSVDLIYNGLHGVADSTSVFQPRAPLRPTSSKSASSRSTTKSCNHKGKLSSFPKAKIFGKKDVSLDVVLKRLSNQGPEVSMPPKAAWESKVKHLAYQIDQERDNGMKLTDIEEMLEKKKIRAKKDTEQAKWKSRVRDLEGLLEERKKRKG